MAQNIQLHYDLGRALYKSLDERPWVTTTVEMFKQTSGVALISLSDLLCRRDADQPAHGRGRNALRSPLASLTSLWASPASSRSATS